MLYVPMLIAVDTNDPEVAMGAARAVAENTPGESFTLSLPPGAAALSPGGSYVLSTQAEDRPPEVHPTPLKDKHDADKPNA